MEYKKDLRKVTDTYRGFQTMDSSDHPVVQQAIKAAQLTSEVCKKHRKVYLSNFLWGGCYCANAIYSKYLFEIVLYCTKI